jgi:hypothetical protein
MNSARLNFTAAIFAATLVLAGCGGGDDAEAGSLTALTTVPATTTFTAPVGTKAGVCVGGGSAKVFVYGGAAPYRIDNTVPDYVVIDKTEVGDVGGSFTIMTTAGCLTTGSIVVRDKLNNIVTYTVNNNPAS